MTLVPRWFRSVGPLVVADLRHRYAGSLLGGLWAVISPFVEVVAYTVVFSLILPTRAPGEGVSYALYLAAGLLPWSSLREGLEGSAAVLPDNRWIRRSLVPMELLVARQAVASAVRAVIGLVLVLIVASFHGPFPGPLALLLPLGVLVLQTAALYGLGLVVAPLAAVHPDLRPGLASALTLLTFASPILYPETVISGTVAAALEWNPFTHFLRFYRLAVSAPSRFGGVDATVVLATPLVLVAAGALLKDRLWWAARDRL
jgi:ABC-type polysaccharide/polyol phosphate export permease